MISYRQSDILKRIKRDNNPVGKIYSIIPMGKGFMETTIISVDGGKISCSDGDRFGVGECLGCRDNRAFYSNPSYASPVGRDLYIAAEGGYDEGYSHGKITSIKNGIYLTDAGEQFKAEDYGFISQTEGYIVI